MTDHIIYSSSTFKPELKFKPPSHHRFKNLPATQPYKSEIKQTDKKKMDCIHPPPYQTIQDSPRTLTHVCAHWDIKGETN